MRRIGSVDHVLDGAAHRAEIENLTLALESRGVVGQAVGVLVATHRMTPEAAWQALRRTSQETNVKVARLAPVLVEMAAGATPADEEAARAAARLLPDRAPGADAVPGQAPARPE